MAHFVGMEMWLATSIRKQFYLCFGVRLLGGQWGVCVMAQRVMSSVRVWLATYAGTAAYTSTTRPCEAGVVLTLVVCWRGAPA